MERVIMPELITAEFAEVIAENPEVLKQLVDKQPVEEVIMGQNCALECGNNATNVKLVLCNVTIEVNDSNTHSEDCSNAKVEESETGCNIKTKGIVDNLEEIYLMEMSKELNRLRLEVAILETKMSTINKILRLIPRQILNRKLIARCKIDVNETMEHLKDMKKELEHKTRIVQAGR